VTQVFPQDGVDALADIRPTVLTPPTMVMVAATAKTFFLIDMWYFLFLPVSRTLRVAAIRDS
jgi:hypothetical protein